MRGKHGGREVTGYAARDEHGVVHWFDYWESHRNIMLRRMRDLRSLRDGESIRDGTSCGDDDIDIKDSNPSLESTGVTCLFCLSWVIKHH
jgi:hypothetical protein